ncbi:hypothetical protein CFC21_045859 [Triticum aestivum]|uniref:Uncharacterized protein n=2 Tax=Triticum aestivum TaxID=4565 RepID=A0A3B6GQY4_WHEAT|nr:uncharacterized protein LOC123073949 [Triticum aestivum]KAF7034908.1 hypothetical protein CFC21_045859 [Triticum aestivum]
MADAAAHAPDEFSKWWETFNNGGAAEDEPMVDSDSDFEQGEQGAGEENADVVAGECEREVEPEALAPAGREGGSRAARDCDEKEISEDGHFQLEGVLQGMKSEAAAGRNAPQVPAAETQNEEGQEEYVSEDNYVGGGFRGKKRKATVTAGKLQTVGSGIPNKNAHVAEEISEDSHFQREDVLQGRNGEAAAKLNTLRASGDEIQNEKDQEGYVSEDKVGGGQQGRKRKTTVVPNKQQMTGIKIRKKNAYGECLRVQNQMLRLQLVRKTKELEAEQIRRLELELHFMKKENEFLKKQLEEFKAENEYYKKTAKPQKTRRLCGFCKEYVDHDFRNCPERRASACSEEDDGSI